MQHPFCPNGANVVDRNSDGHFLVVQDIKTGMWQFPGGGVEAGESFIDAAVREHYEETSRVIFEDNLTHIGEFDQKVKHPVTKKIVDGKLHLFVAECGYGAIRTESNSEIGCVLYMSAECILRNKEMFNISYVRLMLYYFRWLKRRPHVRIFGRLADKIEESVPEVLALAI